MSRKRLTLIVLALLLPAVAEAQRPTKNLWINTAELELGRAVKATVPDEQQRLFGRALENAQMAVEKAADNSRSWFVLGRVHAAMGNLSAADSAFDRAEQMWPEYVKETDDERLRAYAEAFRSGSAAIEANNLELAASRLEGARLIYNKQPVALLNLAIVYSRQNEREKAIDAFREALTILQGPQKATLKPEEAKLWTQWEEDVARDLAQALAFANKNEEAAAAYEAYLKRNPDNVTMRSNLAVVYSRMGKTDEAARVYRELLGRDLPAEEFLSVGMGLRRGQQLDQAIVAFEKSIAKNPHQQEAYYNLAYSYWESIQPLEDARATAKPADATAMANQLRPMYEKMIAAANKARALDPANRNVFALLQNGYRGLAQATADQAKANELRLKIPPLMTEYESLPFQVMAVTPRVEGKKAIIEGTMFNVKTTKGQPMKIRVALLDASGSEMGSQEVSVPAPEVEAEADFAAEFAVDKVPAGWKYSIVK